MGFVALAVVITAALELDGTVFVPNTHNQTATTGGAFDHAAKPVNTFCFWSFMFVMGSFFFLDAVGSGLPDLLGNDWFPVAF